MRCLLASSFPAEKLIVKEHPAELSLTAGEGSGEDKYVFSLMTVWASEGQGALEKEEGVG